MILIGLSDQEKTGEIRRYLRSHRINKAFVLSPRKFFFDHGSGGEVVEWADIIEYRFFYRLLQEIDASTLVVVNECLRTQNRYDLTYNCIRHFLNQAGHQLIFQRFPLIEDIEDFMVLFDFDTRSRWKRERFDRDLLAECRIVTRPQRLRLTARETTVDQRTRAAYLDRKKELIDNIGIRDPHTIPRNLYLMSGRARLALVDQGQWHVGRNRRLKIERLQTFREESYPHVPYTVFELPHNFIDFIDFASLAGQTEFEVLVSDLKVDQWYFKRFSDWAGRMEDAHASLS